MEYQGWDVILIITLISSKQLGVYAIMKYIALGDSGDF